MPVTANRAGAVATITVSVDVADILALNGVSVAEKRIRGLRRAADEVLLAIESLRTDEAARTAAVAALTARNAAIAAAAPTGSL